jgi:hypothetical protein
MIDGQTMINLIISKKANHMHATYNFEMGGNGILMSLKYNHLKKKS